MKVHEKNHSHLRIVSIQKVSELMNQSGGGLNSGLILELFSEEEAKDILKIPLSSMGAKDRLV